MKASVKFLALMAMVVALGACGLELPHPTPSSTPFNIEAIPAGNFTRATDTAFEVGDQVSIYLFKGDGLSGIQSWQPWITNAKYTKTDSGFTSNQTYYWYEGQEEGIAIGLYPYSESNTTEALCADGVEFCVKSDQSTHAGYTASDLMTAYKPQLTPTAEKVTLEFDHLLSKLVIDVDNQTAAEIKEVYIDGVQGKINYSFASGVVVTGGEGTLKAGKLAAATEGYTDTYVLVIPPQQASPKLVVTTTNNKQYTYNASDAIDFNMGKVRHLIVTITDSSISTEFDAIVNDWSADENVEFKDQEGGEENPDSGITTIAEILLTGGATIQSATIEGVVISNLELNNLTSKKGLYIQDETAGLQFYLAANHDFLFGDKLRIDLDGANIALYNGAVQISGLALDKITKLSSGNTVEPKVVSIDEFLTNKYESQYVAIENVQVANEDLGKTWVSDGAHTKITIEDAKGHSFVVFSSKYATYGAEAVAQGSGTIKGIAGISNGNVQIIFALPSDYEGLTNGRLGYGKQEGMEVNPNWSAYYVPDFETEDGTIYDNVCCIESNDEQGFYLELFTLDDWNNYVLPDMRGYVEDRAAYLVEYIANYNATNGTDYTLANLRTYYTGPGRVYYLMEPGTWVVAMWGMTTEGEVTGLYAASEPITIVDTKYNAWLGNWEIYDGENRSYITLTADVVGESYNMEGWNNIGGIPTKVKYNAENDSLVFYGQVVGENVEVGEDMFATIYFAGVGTDGGLYANLDMAEAIWYNSDSDAVVRTYSYSYTNEAGEEMPLSFSEIRYFMAIEGTIYYATEMGHNADSIMEMSRINNETRVQAKDPLLGDSRFKRLETSAPSKYKPISGLFKAGECRFNF